MRQSFLRRGTAGMLVVVVTAGGAAIDLVASRGAQAEDTARVALIAYQGNDRLYTMHPDGSHVTPLGPRVPSNAKHMDWSPDGTQLVFEADEPGDATGDLWVTDARGEVVTRVVDCQPPCWTTDAPAWSPDGRSIAYFQDDLIDGHFPGSKLQILDLETSTVRTVLMTDPPDFIGDVRWAPDGDRVVVGLNTYREPDASDEITARRLAIVDLTESAPTLDVLDTVDQAAYPDWHPTGERILYMAGLHDPANMRAQRFDLYTIAADGSDERQLTYLGPTDPVVWMPTWSADGSSILVTVTDRNSGAHRLGWLAADGTGPELFLGPVYGAHPRQSRGTILEPTPTPLSEGT